MPERFINNCNGTVTDTLFGRMWRRFSLGQTWNSRTNTLDTKELSWIDAKELKSEYAGHSDWRLPTIDELESLVSTEYKDPTIDNIAFPNTPSLPAWSVTAQNDDPEYGICVDFKGGQIVSMHRSSWNVVRLIRDIEKPPLINTVNSDNQTTTPAAVSISPIQPYLDTRFIDNGDGTVTDLTTQLMWMRCAHGQVLDGKGCVGTAPIYTWNEAVAIRHSFAGYSDWRLPELAELTSIVDKTTSHPAIDPMVFPETNSRGFWTASSNEDAELRWYVEFGQGNAVCLKPSYALYVRLVRVAKTKKLLASNNDQQNIHVVHETPAPMPRVELSLDSARGIIQTAIDLLRLYPTFFADELNDLRGLLAKFQQMVESSPARTEHDAETPKPAKQVASSSTLLQVLEWLIEIEFISPADLRRHLLPLDMLPSAVIDEINEKAFDLVGEPALEENGDQVIVYREVLSQVLKTIDSFGA